MAGRHEKPYRLLVLRADLLGCARRDLLLDGVAGRVLHEEGRWLLFVEDDDGAPEPVGESMHVRLAHEIKPFKDVRQLGLRLAGPPRRVRALLRVVVLAWDLAHDLK